MKTRTTIAVGLWTTLLAHGCADPSASSSTAPSKPEISRKDHALLDWIAGHPRDCSADGDCPTGSYCDADRHACTWDCFASSDCGPDFACDAQGRCVDESELEPRDSAALGLKREALTAAGAVPCAFSDDCPLGQYCDVELAKCTADCAAPGVTDETPGSCPAGTECNDIGRCSVGGALSMPRLSLAASTLELASGGNPSETTKAITVRLSTTDAAYASTAGAPVTVRADEGVEVQCGATGTTPPTTGFSSSCVLSGWKFAKASRGFVAPQTVWARLSSAARADQRSWSVSLASSEIIADARAVAIVRSETLINGRPAVGLYGGELTLVGSQSTVTGASSKNVLAPVKIAVSAHVTSDGMLFVDPTRQLSSTGTLWYPFAGTGESVETWLAARAPNPDVPSAPANTGALSVRLTKDASTPLALSNRVLSGGFQLALDLPGSRSVKLRFELMRSGDEDAQRCEPTANVSDCPGAQQCDARAGLCLPGPKWQPTAAPGDSLAHAGVESWFREAQRALSLEVESMQGPSRDELLPNPYSTAQRASSFMGTSLLGSAPLGTSSTLDTYGYAQCKRWFHAPSASWPTPRTLPSVTGCTPSGTVRTDGDLCDRLYDIDQAYWDGCGGSTRAQDGLTYAALERTFLPCLYQSKTAPQVSIPYELSCTSLYWAQNNPETTTQSFDTFLARSCVPSKVDMSVYDSSGGARMIEVEVYLCPDATRASLGNTAATTERAACYPADAATRADIHSQSFDAVASRVTGSILCQDRSAPLELPLLTARDRVPPGGSTPTTSDLLAACLAELAQAPQATQTNPTAALVSAFKPGTCASLGRFAATLETARQTFPNYYLELLRQWAAVHAFVATQGRIEWQSSRVLASASDGSGAPYENAAEASELRGLLETLERGWDLILAARHAATLANLPSTQASYPDYRERYRATDRVPGHEQAIALAAALLNGATRHLEVSETFAEGVAMEQLDICAPDEISATREDAVERIGASLRYAFALERMAETLATKTYTTDQRKLVDRARQELRAVRHRVLARTVGLMTCQNPLGIDDDSVPLYFSTGSTDEERFFAATRHLSGLADTAVSEAVGAIDSARTAWINQRSSRVQETTTQQEADRRVDELRRRYGEPIVEACGLTLDSKLVLDAFASTASKPLYAETCFRDLSRTECSSANDAAGIDASCLHGNMGEALLSSIAAQQEAKAALQTWQDAQGAYDLQVQYCLELETDIEVRDALRDEHNQHLKNLEDQKFDADVAAIALDAATTCASGAVASFGAVCGTAAGAAVAKGFSAKYAKEMAESEREFEANLQKLEGRQQIKACAQEAKQRHFGITTAQLQYQRRTTDAINALVHFFNLRDSIEQQLAEGRAALDRELGRVVPSIAHHYWFDEKVRTFERKMRRAQKLAYIAVQAVEYEMQLSTGLRGDVLRAHHPDQLDAVLERLHDYTETNSINGRRAGMNSFVLSLRDDILGLRIDKSTGAEIDPYDVNTRLRRRLLSPAASFYDADGNYLGQGVRFSVSDLTTSRTDARCAERLWAVGASVVGDQLTRASTVQLELHHRNTFASKWCDAPVDALPLEVGKFRPGGTLFGASTESTYAQDASGFLGATLVAGVNVPRRDLEGTGLRTTEELAARGLYGDYVLLFPTDPHELDLTALEDVLIRFDYVSVNRGGVH